MLPVHQPLQRVIDRRAQAREIAATGPDGRGGGFDSPEHDRLPRRSKSSDPRLGPRRWSTSSVSGPNTRRHSPRGRGHRQCLQREGGSPTSTSTTRTGSVGARRQFGARPLTTFVGRARQRASDGFYTYDVATWNGAPFRGCAQARSGTCCVSTFIFFLLPNEMFAASVTMAMADGRLPPSTALYFMAGGHADIGHTHTASYNECRSVTLASASPTTRGVISASQRSALYLTATEWIYSVRCPAAKPQPLSSYESAVRRDPAATADGLRIWGAK